LVPRGQRGGALAQGVHEIVIRGTAACGCEERGSGAGAPGGLVVDGREVRRRDGAGGAALVSVQAPRRRGAKLSVPPSRPPLFACPIKRPTTPRPGAVAHARICLVLGSRREELSAFLTRVPAASAEGGAAAERGWREGPRGRFAPRGEKIPRLSPARSSSPAKISAPLLPPSPPPPPQNINRQSKPSLDRPHHRVGEARRRPCPAHIRRQRAPIAPSIHLQDRLLEPIAKVVELQVA